MTLIISNDQLYSNGRKNIMYIHLRTCINFVNHKDWLKILCYINSESSIDYVIKGKSDYLEPQIEICFDRGSLIPRNLRIAKDSSLGMRTRKLVTGAMVKPVGYDVNSS